MRLQDKNNIDLSACGQIGEKGRYLAAVVYRERAIRNVDVSACTYVDTVEYKDRQMRPSARRLQDIHKIDLTAFTHSGEEG